MQTQPFISTAATAYIMLTIFSGTCLMKHRPSLTKKQLLLSSLCLLGIFALLLGLFSTNSASGQFQKACDRLFKEEMLANTLNMHYTITNPADYGISDYEVILPCYASDNREESSKAITEYLELFQGLDASGLSEEDSYTLELLISYLETSLALNEFAYYEEPLSPSSGMQSQLPILLAEYTFRTGQDVEDYLKLLDQTDEYFASLLTYEQEKAAAGMLMAASSLEEVIEQCDTILTKEALEEGTHFLQTTFEERLDTLLEEGILTQKEADSYISQNNRLLSTVLLPAYEALGDGLLILQDDDIGLTGLAAYPKGQAYYEVLLRSETGSSRSIEEIKQMLRTQLNEEYEILISFLAGYDETQLSDVQDSLTEVFPVTEADDMLSTLIRCMASDFPALSTTGSQPTVRIKTVSESLEDYCAPAFYLTPPLDDTESNVIYINHKNSPNGLELFTTLAHEGYPGHMYQSVYSNNLLATRNCGTVRQLLWYGGYMEGWALYVEFLSYDYASQLVEDAGYSAYAEYIQIEKHSRNLQLCLYSLLDIMIHYENTSYSQIHKTLSAFGITSAASTSAIYEYIVEEPANYLKYYLGYLEILSLQKEAYALWEDAYTDYDFHKFMLDYGPADFATLQKKLEQISP